MTIDARAAVLRVARALRWIRETGPNRGAAVDAMIRSTGLLPPQPWCAAFVAYVGRAVVGSEWPLPNVAGCVALADAAVATGTLRREPAIGAIFLLYGEEVGRFRHTGFVLGATAIPPGGSWRTIEGNTNAAGSAEGDGVYERIRTFAPRDRFIHWWEATPPGGTTA